MWVCVFVWLFSVDFDLISSCWQSLWLQQAGKNKKKEKKKEEKKTYTHTKRSMVIHLHRIFHQKCWNFARINFNEFLFYLRSFYGHTQIFEKIMHLVVVNAVVSFSITFHRFVYLSPIPFRTHNFDLLVVHWLSNGSSEPTHSLHSHTYKTISNGKMFVEFAMIGKCFDGLLLLCLFLASSLFHHQIAKNPKMMMMKKQENSETKKVKNRKAKLKWS